MNNTVKLSSIDLKNNNKNLSVSANNSKKKLSKNSDNNFKKTKFFINNSQRIPYFNSKLLRSCNSDDCYKSSSSINNNVINSNFDENKFTPKNEEVSQEEEKLFRLNLDKKLKFYIPKQKYFKCLHLNEEEKDNKAKKPYEKCNFSKTYLNNPIKKIIYRIEKDKKK